MKNPFFGVAGFRVSGGRGRPGKRGVSGRMWSFSISRGGGKTIKLIKQKNSRSTTEACKITFKFTFRYSSLTRYKTLKGWCHEEKWSKSYISGLNS